MQRLTRALPTLLIAAGTAHGQGCTQADPATCQVDIGADVLVQYGFEGVTVVDGTVCDDGGFNSAHALVPAAGSTVVAASDHFGTFYADTLCADGSKALHASDCDPTSSGAAIGVVNNESPTVGPGTPGTDYGNIEAPEGANFFQINANGVDGFTYVCFEEFVTDATATPLIASIQVYNAQAGWHEEGDRLRVWAEVANSAGEVSAVTMLPQTSAGDCVAEVTKHNIDSLLLRQSATQSEFTGEHNTDGDPAILQDSFQWTTLSAELGSVRSAKVCAGLQTGAGHEMLWLDDYKLTAGTLETATCPITLPDYSVSSCPSSGSPTAPSPTTNGARERNAIGLAAFVAMIGFINLHMF